MVLKEKFRTVRKVFMTFGVFELTKLSIHKLMRNQEKSGLAAKPEGIETIDTTELNNDFYLDVFDASVEEIESAREKYSHYKDSFARQLYKARTSFFDSAYDLGLGMSEILFVAINVKKPLCIIETGVAAGVSSNVILTALEMNEAGKLVSIDITDKVGELIGGNLKIRWELKVLPDLARENAFAKYLKSNSNATIFLHDSDHSALWQIFEFRNIMLHLPNIELILFDDVSQELINFIQNSYPELRITVVDEGKKYSAVIFKIQVG